MTSSPNNRRLVVNADDFGRSESINCAVIEAHERGILTTGSLMVNEPDCAAAVELARTHPRLGVGLHLALLCGRSALPHSRIPGLVDAHGRFTDNPAAAGFRYFFNRALRGQLRAEIRAQFEAFRATGLALDHVNGHLHLHLHPVVFKILLDLAPEFGVRHVRLTHDPLRLDLRVNRGQWLYRLSHALIFGALSRSARGSLTRAGLRHTQHVFGLLRNARVDEEYITRLLPRLPPGISELYSHPSLDEFKAEFDGLVSPAVGKLVRTLGIELIRYQDF